MSQTATDGRTKMPDRIKPKIPMYRRWPPEVRVDEKQGGEWEKNNYTLMELPDEAARAFLQFNGVPQEIRQMDSHPLIPGDPSDYPKFDEGSKDTVWMCRECADRDDEYGNLGYLSQQDACKITEYRDPSCSHTYEVEHGMGGGTSTVDSPESWRVYIHLNGERRAPTSTDPERTLVVRDHGDEYDHGNPEAETVVGIPNAGGTIRAETGGKEWEADVTHRDDGTVEAEWRRETPDGECLEATADTRIDDRECSGSSFKKVYPRGMAVDEDDYVDVAALDADAVPNHPSHLGRIRNNVSRGLSGTQMVEEVAEAIEEFYREHGRQ